MPNPADQAEKTINAILVGGPADLPDNARLRSDVGTENTIKVQHLGGYEHFERTDETAEGLGAVSVFRWITRTKVAE